MNKQVREISETQSAFSVIKNEFFEKEKEQHAAEHPRHQRGRRHAFRQRVRQDVQKYHRQHRAHGKCHPALDRSQSGIKRECCDSTGSDATDNGGDDDGEERQNGERRRSGAIGKRV